MNRAVTASAVGTEVDTDSTVLREYYREHDYFVSPAGILKVLSVLVCIVSSALLLSGGACGAAPGLPAGGAALALGGAASSAALVAAAALALPLHAPMAYLFTDLILSTAIGIVMLVIAILSMTLCTMVHVIDYVHGPLALVNAGIVTGSAVVTYVSVTRRWDAARRAPPRADRPPAYELEV